MSASYHRPFCNKCGAPIAFATSKRTGKKYPTNASHKADPSHAHGVRAWDPHTSDDCEANRTEHVAWLESLSAKVTYDEITNRLADIAIDGGTLTDADKVDYATAKNLRETYGIHWIGNNDSIAFWDHAVINR